MCADSCEVVPRVSLPAVLGGAVPGIQGGDSQSLPLPFPRPSLRVRRRGSAVGQRLQPKGQTTDKSLMMSVTMAVKGKIKQ